MAKIDAQASIFNRYNLTLASIVLEFIEKINQLQNLEKNDIIMIENIRKIMKL
ncbi:hypothetical protein [Thomasclavelia spiroformis]|uniref:hypothetical protein n=1 Tax=Thomasclavelia spiroformis TaxID=29348 RepID=UPI00265FE022|nr:hypothetical protein [Thomasclavelia spiroformis]